MAAPPGGLPLWGRVLALPLPPSSLCCRPVTAPRAPPARAGCLCCPSIPRAALPPSHFSCPWRLLCFPGVFPMPCYSLATKPELRRCSRLQNAVCASLSGDHRHPEAPGCFPCSSGTPSSGTSTAVSPNTLLLAFMPCSRTSSLEQYSARSCFEGQSNFSFTTRPILVTYYY